MPDIKILIQVISALIVCAITFYCAKATANKQSDLIRWFMWFVAIYAMLQVIIVISLWINHLTIPFSLEGGDGIHLMEVQRILAGQPLYPSPSSDYVPFVYMPLYHLMAAPFVWLFGGKLFALRILSVLGSIGSSVLIYRLIRIETSSTNWGILALGLVAGSYEVLDVYADKIHPDALMLFVILLGCSFVYASEKRLFNVLGLIIVISAFWFKQAAAIFTLGVVLYQTWRVGLRKAWIYWVIATLLGPVLYFVLPQSLTGSSFHYFTSQVPSHWVVFDFMTIRRFLGFIIKHYPLLSLFSLFAFFTGVVQKREKVSIWVFMIPFAFVNGLVGSLDPESEDNLFLLMSIWFILGGVLGIKSAFEYFYRYDKKWLQVPIIGLSFILVLYNPVTLFVPNSAVISYNDLLNRMRVLDGSVYFPWIGHIDDAYEFYPPVQWVAMTDLYRGPGVDLGHDPMVSRILEPVLHPNGNAYILTEIPLDQDPALVLLAPYYKLSHDFGSQYSLVKPLCAGRFCNGAPRYLYQYSP